MSDLRHWGGGAAWKRRSSWGWGRPVRRGGRGRSVHSGAGGGAPAGSRHSQPGMLAGVFWHARPARRAVVEGSRYPARAPLRAFPAARADLGIEAAPVSSKWDPQPGGRRVGCLVEAWSGLAVVEAAGDALDAGRSRGAVSWTPAPQACRRLRCRAPPAPSWSAGGPGTALVQVTSARSRPVRQLQARRDLLEGCSYCSMRACRCAAPAVGVKSMGALAERGRRTTRGRAQAARGGRTRSMSRRAAGG